MNKKIYARVIIAVLVILLIALIFMRQEHWTQNIKSKVSALTKKLKREQLDIPDERTLLTSTPVGVKESDTLNVLGYTGPLPWNEAIKGEDLDQSVFVSHRDFVKDTRRFSSGANFTSVADDNTNSAFTNFQGLRRPQHVPIGPTARQQPDVDQSVLKRNADLRFTNGPRF